MALSAAASQLKRLLANLPLPDERIPEAERLIKECSEAELAQLGLAAPPRPVVPRGLIESGKGADGKPGGVQQRLHAVQQVINSLQYNHAPGYYYNVSKSRPFSRIMDTAREALRLALPIKCLEAVFLGSLLTAGWQELDRLPLGFKSTVQGQTYRHIVLVVFHNPSRKWGALGLSRRPELMDKDLMYDSLADLVSEYKKSYERWWHSLVRVYVGLPLEHDTYYAGPVCWRYLTLSLSGRKSWASHRTALDKFAGQARKLAAKFRALGGKPASEGSLGGPDTQLHTAAGPGSGAAAAVAAATMTGPALYAAAAAAATARCAKSVSPARRRPPAPLLPPPPPRRPLTPARAGVAAPGSPTKAVPAAAGKASAANPYSEAAGAATPGRARRGQEPVTHEAESQGAAPGKKGGSAGRGPGASGSGADDGGTKPVDAARSPEISSGPGGVQHGGSSVAREDGPEMDVISSRESGLAGSQARRCSDPGSAAACAVTAAAEQNECRNAREQTRMLRQQVMAEEQDAHGLVGTPPRCDGENDEDAVSDTSEEVDYLSDKGG